MKLSNLIILSFILTSITACEINPKDKIIGAWTVNEVNGEHLKDNFSEGTLISFSEKNKFHPGNGIWSIKEQNDIAYLTIEVTQKNRSKINGTYMLTFEPSKGNSPSIIILESVTKSNNNYMLSRLTFDFKKYM